MVSSKACSRVPWMSAAALCIGVASAVVWGVYIKRAIGDTKGMAAFDNLGSKCEVVSHPPAHPSAPPRQYLNSHLFLVFRLLDIRCCYFARRLPLASAPRAGR